MARCDVAAEIGHAEPRGDGHRIGIGHSAVNLSHFASVAPAARHIVGGGGGQEDGGRVTALGGAVHGTGGGRVGTDDGVARRGLGALEVTVAAEARRRVGGGGAVAQNLQKYKGGLQRERVTMNMWFDFNLFVLCTYERIDGPVPCYSTKDTKMKSTEEI